MFTVPIRLSRTPAILAQVIFSLLLGMLAFILTTALFVAAFQIRYAGRIYPGVHLGGIDVGGLTIPEASQKISRKLNYPTNGRLLLRDGEQAWAVAPVDIGLFLDPETSARNAYNIGRSGGPGGLKDQFTAWHSGYDLPLTIVFDQRMAFNYLSSLQNSVNRPVIEAHLGVQGTDVIVRNGQNGRELDTSATLEAITRQLSTFQNGEVKVVVKETPAMIVDPTRQAELARRILSRPLVLNMPTGQPDQNGPWIFDPPALAAMLVLERIKSGEGEEYQVTLNSQMLRVFLEQIKPGLHKTTENTRFIFNDNTKALEVIQAAVVGRELDVETSIKAIQSKITAGEHDIPLEFTFTQPQVNDQTTAGELGITQLVSSQTTYFYGSSATRIQNIVTAASRFHGLLVPPNSIFSMGSELGDVSLDAGYAEALIIYGDQTIKGVGGGVCQVSTTLFRTAFFGGYPIIERYPHAYRVSYYEKNAQNRTVPELVGLDATVYTPQVDFKFENDTPYWILMEVYVEQAARYITWKFYSTSDGRSVEWSNSGPTNIVPKPETIYRENPELEKDEIEQVDWGVDGADITIERKVKKNGAIYLEDKIFTHYLPWRDVYEYGPGSENIPTPGPTVTPTP